MSRKISNIINKKDNNLVNKFSLLDDMKMPVKRTKLV